MKEALFSKYQWYNVQKHITEQIKQEIESYNSNQLLNTPIDNLLNYFVQKYKIDIPKIGDDDIYVEQNETQVDVKNHLKINFKNILEQASWIIERQFSYQ